MGRNDRQRLLSMVRGESRRVPLWSIRFDGEPPREPEFVDGDEVDNLFEDDPIDENGVVYQVLFECPDDDRDRVLRESPCLVRQADGRFTAQNVGKEGPVYLVEL